MPLPSQYFVDKTEALVISNALHSAIGDSNLRLNEIRNKQFKKVSSSVNMQQPSQATNPYTTMQSSRDLKSKEKHRQIFTVLPTKDETLAEADDLLKRNTDLTQKVAQHMNVKDVGIDLGDIKIAQKREAYYVQGHVVIQPAQFELENDHVQVIDHTVEQYVTNSEAILDELDTQQKVKLDNRIPKRIIDYKEQQKKNELKLKQAAEKAEAEQVIVAVQNKQQIIKKKAKLQQHQPPIIKTITKQMLDNVNQLQLNQNNFISGSCQCKCHQTHQQQRICPLCFCVQDKEETQIIQNTSHNLLKDAQIPTYKQPEQNMQTFEGKITNEVIKQLVDQQMSKLSPNKQLLLAAEQTKNLANKMWSPVLRSDISPGIDLMQLEKMLSEKSIYDLNQISFENETKMKLRTQSVLAKALIQNFKPSKFDIEKEENKQVKKQQRMQDIQTLIEVRKKEDNAVMKQIHDGQEKDTLKQSLELIRSRTQISTQISNCSPQPLEPYDPSTNKSSPDSVIHSPQSPKHPYIPKPRAESPMKVARNCKSELRPVKSKYMNQTTQQQKLILNKQTICEQNRNQTKKRLQELVEETNMTEEQIQQMAERTRKRLEEMDSKINANIEKSYEPVNFSVLRKVL
ncbi:Conserved_hypothetical protein [Hexamita inflata]|uniref:Uncharacterized protein n=1 Tax=Hexamita inflata TaxID=28002 RepID=A0AA86R4P2_9EUKA|nr:Conserved hypothetical protein [Hexamita inflata]